MKNFPLWLHVSLRPIVAISFFMMLAVPQGRAANSSGGFVSIDPELSTCKDLLNADRSKKPSDGRREALLNWIGGFITAYNATTPGVTNVTEKFFGQAKINVAFEVLKACETEKPDKWISRVVLEVLDHLRDDLPKEGHKE